MTGRSSITGEVTRYLSLAEFWYLAEHVTDINVATLIKASRVELADSALHAPQAGFGDTDFHPDVYDNDGSWNDEQPDTDDAVEALLAVAAREVDELARELASRTGHLPNLSSRCRSVITERNRSRGARWSRSVGRRSPIGPAHDHWLLRPEGVRLRNLNRDGPRPTATRHSGADTIRCRSPYRTRCCP